MALLSRNMNEASTPYANNPIRDAYKEQAIEEITPFLLGSVSEVWGRWEVEAGDDSGLVSCNPDKISPRTDLTLFYSNAIRNDLVRD